MKYLQNFIDVLHDVQKLKLWDIILGGICAIVALIATNITKSYITAMIIYHDNYTTNMFIFIFLWLFLWVLMRKVVSVSVYAVKMIYDKMTYTKKIKFIINNRLSLQDLSTVLFIAEINKLEFSDKRIRNRLVDFDNTSLQCLCKFNLIRLYDIEHTGQFGEIPICRYTIDKRNLKIFIENKEYIMEKVVDILKTEIPKSLNIDQIVRLLDFLSSPNMGDYVRRFGWTPELEIINGCGLFINSSILVKALTVLKNQAV